MARRTNDILKHALLESLNEARLLPALQCLNDASEVVVFGSVASGLQRPESDIDILCVGRHDFRMKTRVLDLIAVSANTLTTRQWLGSELASHIVKYGTWIEGNGTWSSQVRLGRRALYQKHRRVAAYMQSLPNAWYKLNEGFKRKYAVKLRRDTQRLILLERNVPVPPTKVLDCSWDDVGVTPSQVRQHLQHLASDTQRSAFCVDLLNRMDLHFQSVRYGNSV